MASINAPVGTIIQAEAYNPADFATRYTNLASEDFGAKVIECTDEWFAAAQRMLQDSEPVFIVGKFDDHGKWMDGWETRRRRNGGHDTAIIKLAFAGTIKGIDINTSHFTGNYPPSAAVEACYSPDKNPDAQTTWTEIVPAASLQGNSHHFFDINHQQVWTHLRLHIYPDGGVARFRVYGQPAVDWSTISPTELVEVSALAYGGRIIGFNNAHFGTPFRLIMPGRGVNMGDGWETRRRREPGYDWCILELGHAAVIEKIEIDTAHFKGNYPDRVSIQAANISQMTDQSIITNAMFWDELLPTQKTEMDKQHFYDQNQINASLGPVTHVRVNMFPDGGISRVRLWGRLGR